MRSYRISTSTFIAEANGFVLGISGGQDSSLAGRLCQLAVDRINQSGGSAEFVAVLLPYGVQADQADVDTAIDYIVSQSGLHFNPRLVTLLENRIDAVRDLYTAYPDSTFSTPADL